MRSVLRLRDGVPLPEHPVGPGRRPRLLARVPQVGARVVLVRRGEVDLTLLQPTEYVRHQLFISLPKTDLFVGSPSFLLFPRP